MWVFIVKELTSHYNCCFAYTCSGYLETVCTSMGNCLLQSEAKVANFLVYQMGDNSAMRGANALKNLGYANNIFWPWSFRLMEHLPIDKPARNGATHTFVVSVYDLNRSFSNRR
jgi:hypothetical protein